MPVTLDATVAAAAPPPPVLVRDGPALDTVDAPSAPASVEPNHTELLFLLDDDAVRLALLTTTIIETSPAGYGEARAAIPRALRPGGDVDVLGVVEALGAERSRWLRESSSRLARFGYTPSTF